MAEPDLKFVEGEFGFTHTFRVHEDSLTGGLMDLTGNTGARLVIKSLVDGSTLLDETGTNLTVNDAGTVDWDVQNGQTNFNGNHDGELIVNFGAGQQVKTVKFTVVAQPKVA